MHSHNSNNNHIHIEEKNNFEVGNRDAQVKENIDRKVDAILWKETHAWSRGNEALQKNGNMEQKKEKYDIVDALYQLEILGVDAKLFETFCKKIQEILAKETDPEILTMIGERISHVLVEMRNLQDDYKKEKNLLLKEYGYYYESLPWIEKRFFSEQLLLFWRALSDICFFLERHVPQEPLIPSEYDEKEKEAKKRGIVKRLSVLESLDIDQDLLNVFKVRIKQLLSEEKNREVILMIYDHIRDLVDRMQSLHDEFARKKAGYSKQCDYISEVLKDIDSDLVEKQSTILGKELLEIYAAIDAYKKEKRVIQENERGEEK